MIHGLDASFLVAAELLEHAEHIQSLLTTNPADFTGFGVFTCITPMTSATNP